MPSDFINSPGRLIVASALTLPVTALGFYVFIALLDGYDEVRLDSWWIRTGLVIMYIGFLPFVFYFIASLIGLLSDPDNNMVGPGVLMTFCSFFGMLVIQCGTLWRRFKQRND
jgi:hypothetical protein